MAIERWHPVREFRGLSRFIDDVIDEFVRSPLFSVAKERTGMIIPPVDVSETDDEIVVTSELPGMKKEDIKLSLEDNVLTISGEKKEEREEKEKNFHLLERSFGSFRRSVSLPTSIEAGKVKASYKDGVLTVTIPKKEGAKPKEIKVE